IKDKKGTENVAANHPSRLENDETSDDSEVADNFPGETLMEINTKNEPWFADFANYLVGDIIPKGMTYQQRNKFFSDLKYYFWEVPYLFKVCSDGLLSSEESAIPRLLWAAGTFSLKNMENYGSMLRLSTLTAIHFPMPREECPKNPGLGVAKNLKKPSQASKGISVGPKVGFKPATEYRPVLKKLTNNTSDNKKKGAEPTKEVDYLGDHDSEDEVESVDNDMAHSMATERVGCGTNSLLEQWRDCYGNGDYDEDPYDDDMYEGHDIPDNIQDTCDNLDIRVRGCRKK
ncbi:hypothetical protein Tco_0812308, partial [Tanacetum coccineum]